MSTNPYSAKAGSTNENQEEENMNDEYPETNSYEIPEIYLDNNKDPNNIPLGNEMSEIEKEKKLNETEK